MSRPVRVLPSHLPRVVTHLPLGLALALLYGKHGHLLLLLLLLLLGLLVVVNSTHPQDARSYFGPEAFDYNAQQCCKVQGDMPGLEAGK